MRMSVRMRVTDLLAVLLGVAMGVTVVLRRRRVVAVSMPRAGTDDAPRRADEEQGQDSEDEQSQGDLLPSD
jgi:hypothetical protein